MRIVTGFLLHSHSNSWQLGLDFDLSTQQLVPQNAAAGVFNTNILAYDMRRISRWVADGLRSRALNYKDSDPSSCFSSTWKGPLFPSADTDPTYRCIEALLWRERPVYISVQVGLSPLADSDRPSLATPLSLQWLFVSIFSFHSNGYCVRFVSGVSPYAVMSSCMRSWAVYHHCTVNRLPYVTRVPFIAVWWCSLKFVTIASFTVLCWDHIITFSDEVRLSSMYSNSMNNVDPGGIDLASAHDNQ